MPRQRHELLDNTSRFRRQYTWLVDDYIFCISLSLPYSFGKQLRSGADCEKITRGIWCSGLSLWRRIRWFTTAMNPVVIKTGSNNEEKSFYYPPTYRSSSTSNSYRTDYEIRPPFIQQLLDGSRATSKTTPSVNHHQVYVRHMRISSHLEFWFPIDFYLSPFPFQNKFLFFSN